MSGGQKEEPDFNDEDNLADENQNAISYWSEKQSSAPILLMGNLVMGLRWLAAKLEAYYICPMRCD